MLQETVAIRAVHKRNVQHLGVFDGLLHPGSNAVPVIFRLDDSQWNIGLVVEQIVSALSFASGSNITTDDNTTVREVVAAKEILKALDLREGAIDIRSCPTCGRTEVDLERIATEIEARLSALEEARAGRGRLKVAVMGCAVNGPGEAREADIGVACGRGEGLIFRRGEIIKKVKESEIVEETARMVMEYENL